MSEDFILESSSPIYVPELAEIEAEETKGRLLQERNNLQSSITHLQTKLRQLQTSTSIRDDRLAELLVKKAGDIPKRNEHQHIRSELVEKYDALPLLNFTSRMEFLERFYDEVKVHGIQVTRRETDKILGFGVAFGNVFKVDVEILLVRDESREYTVDAVRKLQVSLAHDAVLKSLLEQVKRTRNIGNLMECLHGYYVLYMKRRALLEELAGAGLEIEKTTVLLATTKVTWDIVYNGTEFVSEIRSFDDNVEAVLQGLIMEYGVKRAFLLVKQQLELH